MNSSCNRLVFNILTSRILAIFDKNFQISFKIFFSNFLSFIFIIEALTAPSAKKPYIELDNGLPKNCFGLGTVFNIVISQILAIFC